MNKRTSRSISRRNEPIPPHPYPYPKMLCVLWTLLLLSSLWCGPAAAFIVHGCEGNHVKIMCPMPTMQVILIKSAMYGRRSDPRGSPGRCGENLTLYRKCEADITPYVKYRCEGQPFCEVYVDVATFGLEMCADVRKYAEVDYDCVQSQALDTINSCVQQCVPGATAASGPSSPFAMKHFGASKAQIPGPATGNAISHSHFPSASAPATNFASASSSAAVPSPQRAASSSLSSSAASVPSASPSAPALPYSSLSRSIAAAMGNGSGTKSSTSGPAQNPMQSAAMRANLMNRMRRILIAIRNRRQG